MTDSMVRQYLASDAAREHYAKTMPELGSFVDPREARITKLEAEVAKFEKQVQGYDTLLAIVLTDLADLGQRYRNVKLERDMLAKRIQELLARENEIDPSDDVSPILAAIEVHQKQGVR